MVLVTQRLQASSLFRLPSISWLFLFFDKFLVFRQKFICLQGGRRWAYLYTLFGNNKARLYGRKLEWVWNLSHTVSVVVAIFSAWRITSLKAIKDRGKFGKKTWNFAHQASIKPDIFLGCQFVGIGPSIILKRQEALMDILSLLLTDSGSNIFWKTQSTQNIFDFSRRRLASEKARCWLKSLSPNTALPFYSHHRRHSALYWHWTNFEDQISQHNFSSWWLSTRADALSSQQRIKRLTVISSSSEAFHHWSFSFYRGRIIARRTSASLVNLIFRKRIPSCVTDLLVINKKRERLRIRDRWFYYFNLFDNICGRHLMFVSIKMREIVYSNIPMDFKIESNDFLIVWKAIQATNLSMNWRLYLEISF